MMKRLLMTCALVGALTGAAPSMAADEAAPAAAPAAVATTPAAAPDKAPAAAPVAATTAPAAATPAPAAEAPKKIDSGDTAWMLMSTVLVILMIIPGLALFYGGLVRAKNMLSILMQIFVIFAMVSVIWALYGYSFAFTEAGGGLNAFIGGASKMFLAGVTPETFGAMATVPEYVFMMFQLTFACITPALIIGAFAERIKFSAVLMFIALWVTFVYLPMAHMVWGGGWMMKDGVLDFAGGTVVHINGGIAGLVAALLLGKRIGYGTTAMPPHNLTFTMVGASLLWVGWFGFNAGSAGAANGQAGLAMANTQLATAAATMAWMAAEWIFKGKPSLLGAVSGAVAGLVAITPACAFVGPMGAMIMGSITSVVCFWSVMSMKHKFGYDDALDAFGVHGVGGIVGAILTGVFVSKELGGVGFADGMNMAKQVSVQAISVVFTLIYSGILSTVLFKITDVVCGARVTVEQERQGLDISSHGESAYNN